MNDASHPARSDRADLLWRFLLGLLPLWILFLWRIAYPESWNLLGAEVPAVVGLSLGLLLVVLALGLSHWRTLTSDSTRNTVSSP